MISPNIGLEYVRESPPVCSRGTAKKQIYQNPGRGREGGRKGMHKKPKKSKIKIKMKRREKERRTRILRKKPNARFRPFTVGSS